MDRSSAIDILLAILGAYLLLQSLGGLIEPSFIPGLFLALLFGLMGGLLIFAVYYRRKSRSLKERERSEEMIRVAALQSIPVSYIQIQKRARPVSILGMLTAGNGVAYLVTGLLSLLLAEVVATASSSGTLELFRQDVFGILGPIAESPELLRVFLLTLGFTSLALGAALLVGAYGLLKGREWAWGLAIILAASVIAFDLGFAFLPMSTNPSGEDVIGFPPIGLIIGGVMLYFLFREDVKSHFRRVGPQLKRS